jgi:hypothetical protein
VKAKSKRDERINYQTLVLLTCHNTSIEVGGSDHVQNCWNTRKTEEMQLCRPRNQYEQRTGRNPKTIFRRCRINIEKAPMTVMSSGLPTCISAARTGRIFAKCYIGAFTKTCRGTPNMVKIWLLTLRQTYICTGDSSA